MTPLELILHPIAQDPAYHLFADQRMLLGIPHFWNVVSNLPFLVVSALGLRLASRDAANPLPCQSGLLVGKQT